MIGPKPKMFAWMQTPLERKTAEEQTESMKKIARIGKGKENTATRLLVHCLEKFFRVRHVLKHLKKQYMVRFRYNINRFFKNFSHKERFNALRTRLYKRSRRNVDANGSFKIRLCS